jgi:GH24 family phage-related lysozyme (muramidase)
MNNSLLNLEDNDIALMERIKENEGYSIEPYQLSYTDRQGNIIKEDFYTGGYGTKLTPEEYSFISGRLKYGKPTGVGSKEMIEKIYEEKFLESFNTAKEDAKVYMDSYGIKNVPQEVKGVIIEMAYNMGRGNLEEKKGLMSFKGFASALREGDYDRAISELKYIDPNVPEKGETPFYNKVGPKKNQKEEESRVGKLITILKNVSKVKDTSGKILVEPLEGVQPSTRQSLYSNKYIKR